MKSSGIRKHVRSGKRVFIWAALLSLLFSSMAYAEAPTATDRKEHSALYITASESHSIVYNDEGEVWYWGGMRDFDFPNSTFRDNIPDRMGTMEDIAQVSANLFLKKDGTVWSWLAGPYPVDGSPYKLRFEIQEPTQRDIEDVVKIASGDTFDSAIKKDGTVWVWLPAPVGFGLKPMQIPDMSDAVDIAFARPTNQPTLTIVKKDGTVWKWEGAGTLGNLSPVRATPIDSLTDITGVFTGDQCFFATRKDGSVWGWGSNMHGQLGLKEQKMYRTPELLPDLTDIASIQGNYNHTLALKKDGTVLSWGITLDKYPEYGAAIDPDLRLVEDLDDVASLAVGGAHYLALKQDGTLWAWGSNQYGELGDGSFQDSDKPIPVTLK